MTLTGYTETNSNEFETTTIKDIQMVLDTSKRNDFMTRFNRINSTKDIKLSQLLLKDLSIDVAKELQNQGEEINKIQSQIDSMDNAKERIQFIMSIEDDKTRIKLIQNNAELFSKAIPTVNESAAKESVTYDQESGLYLTDEQVKRQQRGKILAIRDSKERQAMIANNLHLFR